MILVCKTQLRKILNYYSIVVQVFRDDCASAGKLECPCEPEDSPRQVRTTDELET